MKNKNIVKVLALVFSISMSSTYAANLSVNMVSGGGVNNAFSSHVGSTFSIDIVINDTLDLAGFEFDLGFDSTILNATSITSGNIFGINTFSLQSIINANSIDFSEATLAPNGIDIASPTLLSTISFEIIGAGVDTLDLNNVILSDSLGVGIVPVVLNSGNLTSTVPVPSITSVKPIPTLSEWSIIILSIFVGIAGIGYKKEKRLEWR